MASTSHFCAHSAKPVMNSSILSILVLLLVCVQVISSSVVAPSENEQLDYAAFMEKLDQLKPHRFWKRAHNIDTRALSQFKNCYFSPIQCVLMERRRK